MCLFQATWFAAPSCFPSWHTTRWPLSPTSRSPTSAPPSRLRSTHFVATHFVGFSQLLRWFLFIPVNFRHSVGNLSDPMHCSADQWGLLMVEQVVTYRVSINTPPWLKWSQLPQKCHKNRVCFDNLRKFSFWWALKFINFDNIGQRKQGLRLVTLFFKIWSGRFFWTPCTAYIHYADEGNGMSTFIININYKSILSIYDIQYNLFSGWDKRKCL